VIVAVKVTVFPTLGEAGAHCTTTTGVGTKSGLAPTTFIPSEAPATVAVKFSCGSSSMSQEFVQGPAKDVPFQYWIEASWMLKLLNDVPWMEGGAGLPVGRTYMDEVADLEPSLTTTDSVPETPAGTVKVTVALPPESVCGAGLGIAAGRPPTVTDATVVSGVRPVTKTVSRVPAGALFGYTVLARG